MHQICWMRRASSIGATNWIVQLDQSPPDKMRSCRQRRNGFGQEMRLGINSLVPLAGIEPALLAELDFESSASTNSATGANRAAARGRTVLKRGGI